MNDFKDFLKAQKDPRQLTPLFLEETEYISESQLLEDQDLLRPSVEFVFKEMANWSTSHDMGVQISSMQEEVPFMKIQIGEKVLMVEARENRIDFHIDRIKIVPTSRIYGGEFKEGVGVTSLDIDLSTAKETILTLTEKKDV